MNVKSGFTLMTSGEKTEAWVTKELDNFMGFSNPMKNDEVSSWQKEKLKGRVISLCLQFIMMIPVKWKVQWRLNRLRKKRWMKAYLMSRLIILSLTCR